MSGLLVTQVKKHINNCFWRTEAYFVNPEGRKTQLVDAHIIFVFVFRVFGISPLHDARKTFTAEEHLEKHAKRPSKISIA